MTEPRSHENERRRYLRRPVRIPVDYSSVDAFFSEFASNINEGGAFIETDAPEEPGEIVKLMIRLPLRERPLEVEARVVWVRDSAEDGVAPGMGVEFQNLADDVSALINRVVESLRAQPDR